MSFQQPTSGSKRKKISWNFYTFWKPSEAEEKTRYHQFLKDVVSALNKQEIWDNPHHLLHILLQFQQFSKEHNDYSQLLTTLISHRVTVLLTNEWV
ncbi:hypothetical protein Cs308_0304 [Candidatus Chlamydia sanziniae]|uniref:Uncharacterized protein n=2 Tax=Candidatus Chlamydia sanziniae TaxID=1806891 RepID=A0A1A9HUF8_9CHLA|nr:hypothetical protein Cs308_0304 [Candidatus Chlamydia sanziniae]